MRTKICGNFRLIFFIPGTKTWPLIYLFFHFPISIKNTKITCSFELAMTTSLQHDKVKVSSLSFSLSRQWRTMKDISVDTNVSTVRRASARHRFEEDMTWLNKLHAESSRGRPQNEWWQINVSPVLSPIYGEQ